MKITEEDRQKLISTENAMLFHVGKYNIYVEQYKPYIHKAISFFNCPIVSTGDHIHLIQDEYLFKHKPTVINVGCIRQVQVVLMSEACINNAIRNR